MFILQNPFSNYGGIKPYEIEVYPGQSNQYLNKQLYLEPKRDKRGLIVQIFNGIEVSRTPKGQWTQTISNRLLFPMNYSCFKSFITPVLSGPTSPTLHYKVMFGLGSHFYLHIGFEKWRISR